MKSRKTVKESLDYCRCDVCGKREREDRFNLPPLADNNGDAAEHRVWLEFVREHIKDFTDLGFRQMRYSMGFSFNPICERCCEKMYSNPKYKELWKEWCAYRDEAAKRANAPTNESERKQKIKFKKIVGESGKIDLLKDTQVITNGRDAKINVDCPYCGETRYLTSIPMSVWKLGCRKVEQGVPVAKAFPSLNPSDRETLETGKCRICQMKHANESREVVKEAEEGGYASDHPRIYIGTYAKYNDGSIDGKWIDLTDYSTYEEFVDACRELHKDEKDPEFMVQDYENFPEKWYHEGGLPTEEEFDKINDYYLMDDNLKEAFEVFVNYTGLDSTEDFEDAYEGKFSSPEDFAYYIVDSFGFDGIGDIESYFDYDGFGRDLMYDFHQGDEDNTDAEGNPEDPDKYYDNDGYEMGEYESDQQVAYDYIDNLGGFDALGKETAQRYFDYESFGKDLLINDYWEDDGYVFRNI